MGATETVGQAAGHTGPDMRAQLHGMWAAVAPAWGEHAEYADARGVELARRMIELADPRPGERVLELACGPGGLGMAAAGRLRDDGEVVLSDVVAEMASIAAARARALGLRNVSTRVLDVEQIDEPDTSYDVVLCREGLMFATDPARAASEIHRVMRPAGRTAIAVWGPRDRNPWLGLVLDAVSAQIGRPVPPPGIPGPFSLANANQLAKLLKDAGLAEVTVSDVSVPAKAGSFDEWWERTSALAGPLTKILSSLPGAATDAIRGRLRETTEPYRVPTGLEFPGVSLVASAQRR